MPTIANANIPTPKSWDEFEDILLSTAKLRWSSTDFFRHGRSGQRQDGVDVFGCDKDGRSVGVQAKNTVGGIKAKVVEEEIAKAERFDPPLDALYVATTAPRDAAVQKIIRDVSDRRVAAGSFPVELLFWDDVVADLASSDTEFFKHYPQFRPARDDAKEHDRRLFEELTALLARGGLMRFLEETNMAVSFPRSYLDPLQEFHYVWGDAEHEFLHEPLERIRKILHDAAGIYLSNVGVNTWVTHANFDRSSVPPEWELEQPARFTKVVREFHRLAGEMVSAHADLVRTGKAYLLK